MKLKILKIGELDHPASRWNSTRVQNDLIIMSIDESNSFFTKKELNLVKSFYYVSLKFRSSKLISFIYSKVTRILFRFYFFNFKKIRFDYDLVWISYNDYNSSSFLSTLFIPFLSESKIVRLIKESRYEYSYYEEFSLLNSDILYFNSSYSREFFVNKYPRIEAKKFFLGIDEDFRSSDIIDFPQFEKISKNDSKFHIVILSGRVMSDDQDIRSGGRLYYIEIIKSLLDKGFCVHLIAKDIIPDKLGVNRYLELSNSHKNFIIEEPLDFINEPFSSYSSLSRFDFGLLHAHKEGSTVSSFDKINIPNRIYDYRNSIVMPVVNDFHVDGLSSIFTNIDYVKLSNLYDFSREQLEDLLTDFKKSCEEKKFTFETLLTRIMLDFQNNK
jgi:hypothetical protein